MIGVFVFVFLSLLINRYITFQVKFLVFTDSISLCFNSKNPKKWKENFTGLAELFSPGHLGLGTLQEGAYTGSRACGGSRFHRNLKLKIINKLSSLLRKILAY